MCSYNLVIVHCSFTIYKIIILNILIVPTFSELVYWNALIPSQLHFSNYFHLHVFLKYFILNNRFQKYISLSKTETAAFSDVTPRSLVHIYQHFGKSASIFRVEGRCIIIITPERTSNLIKK